MKIAKSDVGAGMVTSSWVKSMTCGNSAWTEVVVCGMFLTGAEVKVTDRACIGP